jgi:hypothetical protein
LSRSYATVADATTTKQRDAGEAEGNFISNLPPPAITPLPPPASKRWTDQRRAKLIAFL